MPTFKSNDNVSLHYETHGSSTSPPLILVIIMSAPPSQQPIDLRQLHGFTGSGLVFKRNIAGLAVKYYVIVPDLRGHGESDKPRAGYHVARLALDFAYLIKHLQLPLRQISAIGTSLGAAIIW